jgi:hypothetical protein
VISGAALCTSCAMTGQPLTRPELPVLRHGMLKRDVTLWHGVVFFTPRTRGVSPLHLLHARKGI